MPETRLERLVAVLGLCTILTLLGVVLRNWPSPTRKPDLSGLSVTVPPPVLHATSAPAAASQTPIAPVTTAGTRPPVLTLAAVGADSWFEARAHASNGPLLYTGILPQGESKSFTSGTVWVRFGAASHIEARYGGRLVNLPPGTYDGTFTKGSFQLASGP